MNNFIKKNNSVTISVALAAYNGEKFIRQQLNSILEQLRICDELVISYNESSDDTFSILTEYQKKDERVKVIVCAEKGIIPNFESAISNTNNDIVILSDQDDVWLPNKVLFTINFFESHDCVALMHNCDLFDENLNNLNISSFDRGVKNGTFHNVIKNSYQGSCLAFKKELKYAILPIPRKVAMHDQWIGIVAHQIGKVFIVDNKLIMYRQHGDNNSSKRLNIFKKLYYILKICKYLFQRRKRVLFTKELLLKNGVK